MHFVAKISDLREAVSIAGQAVSRNSPQEVLKCFLISVDADNVRVIGYDTAIGIAAVCPAEIESSGAVLLTRDSFTRILDSMKGNESIELAVKDDKVLVRSGKAKLDIATQDVSLFPSIPWYDGDDYFEIVGNDAYKALSRVQPFLGASTSNYALAGAYFVAGTNEKGPTLDIVATDRIRVAIASVAAASIGNPRDCSADKVNGTLPRRALQAFAAAAKEALTDTVKLGFVDGGRAFLKTAKAEIVSQLEWGKFPNYQKLMEKMDVQAVLNMQSPAPFLTALAQASAVREKERTGVVIEVDSEGVAMWFEGSTVDSQSEFFTGIEGSSWIIMNPDYMESLIAATSAPKIEFYGPNNPVYVRDENWFAAGSTIIPYAGCVLRKLKIRPKFDEQGLYLGDEPISD